MNIDREIIGRKKRKDFVQGSKYFSVKSREAIDRKGNREVMCQGKQKNGK